MLSVIAPVGPQHPLIKDHGIRNSRAGHVEVSPASSCQQHEHQKRCCCQQPILKLLWFDALSMCRILPRYLSSSADHRIIADLQDYNINTYHFDDQYSTFNSLGYGAAPEGTHYVGDDAAFDQHKGMLAFNHDALLISGI